MDIFGEREKGLPHSQKSFCIKVFKKYLSQINGKQQHNVYGWG